MDIRTQRTRQRIADCFIRLLNEKPAAKITVTEVCDAANINRATFYKHYKDIPDLLEQQGQELLLQLKNFIDDYSEDRMSELTLDLLRYMQSEGTRFYPLGSQNGDPELAWKSFELCYRGTFPVLRKHCPDLSQNQAEMLYFYLSHGCGGVLAWWLQNGMRQPPEDVAKLILDASIGTVKGFSAQPEQI